MKRVHVHNQGAAPAERYAPPSLVDVPAELQFAELPSWIGDVVGRRVVRKRPGAPNPGARTKNLGTKGRVQTKPGTVPVVMPMPDQPEVFIVAFMPEGTVIGEIPVTIPGMVAAVINSIIKLVPHKDRMAKQAKDAADEVEAASGFGCAGRRCNCGR